MTSTLLRNELEIELATIWEDVLGVGPLGPADDFFAQGGTSLSALRMIDAVHARLGRTLPLDALVSEATVAHVASVLARITDAPPRPLVRLRPGSRQPPLVCVHPAGGAILCYRDLSRALPPARPVFAIPDPRIDDELSVEARAALYCDALRAEGLEEPWHLAGHSYGGLVAFEMARQLTEHGHPAGIVFLLDTTAPASRHAAEAVDPVVRLGALLEAAALDDDANLDPAAERRLWDLLAAFAGQALGRDRRRLRLGEVQRFCEQHGFLPPGTTGYPEARRFLRTLRGGLRTARRYIPARYPGHVVLLHAAAGAGPGGDDRARREQQVTQWSALAGRLEVIDVPGTHFDLLSAAHAGELAARIESALQHTPA